MLMSGNPKRTGFFRKVTEMALARIEFIHMAFQAIRHHGQHAFPCYSIRFRCIMAKHTVRCCLFEMKLVVEIMRMGWLGIKDKQTPASACTYKHHEQQELAAAKSCQHLFAFGSFTFESFRSHYRVKTSYSIAHTTAAPLRQPENHYTDPRDGYSTDRLFCKKR